VTLFLLYTSQSYVYSHDTTWLTVFCAKQSLDFCLFCGCTKCFIHTACLFVCLFFCQTHQRYFLRTDNQYHIFIELQEMPLSFIKQLRYILWKWVDYVVLYEWSHIKVEGNTSQSARGSLMAATSEPRVVNMSQKLNEDGQLLGIWPKSRACMQKL
jgi:hypothetical protein